jgi:hypothetical protein
MIVKNANTHAHGGVHLVVLAYLQRRWSLSDRKGFGFFSQARRDLALFGEVKRLSSIAPEARKGGESPECLSLKNSGRTL